MRFFRWITLSLFLSLAVEVYSQNFDWVRTVNGNNGDECLDVAASANTGFVYTTGYFSSSADFLTGPDSLMAASFVNCAYVCKFNAYGDLIWLKTLTSPNGNSKGNGIAIDSDDNVIVVGEFNGTVDFNPADSTEELLTATNSDGFVWKINQHGSFQWVKMLHSSYEVACYGVTADTSNSIVFSGLYTGTLSMSGGFGLSDNDNRGYICKLDSAGNFNWVNGLADVPGDIYPSVVRADADNNYYVTGAYVQNSSPTIGFLQKVFTNGQDSWRVELGNPSGVGFINDVCCSPYGILVCGSFKNQATIGNAVGSHFVTSHGNYFDALAFKLLPDNGQPVWSTVFGSSSDDYGSAIHSDANGNVYVAGRFQGTANYANIPQATVTANGSDTYVWKLDYTGEGIGAYTLTNPAADEITPTAICTATDGAIYLSGRSFGTTDFDQDLVDVEAHTSSGLADGYLHRTTDCDAFLQPQAQELFFCYGDSLEINGVYYDDYQLITTDSLVSQWGCDSLIAVQLITYPHEDFQYYSICHGDSAMLTTGAVFEAGEYVTELTSSHGCDSSFVEIVDWIPSSHTFENYFLCADSVLTIYNEFITAAGDYLFLVENAETTCRDTVSVSVNSVTIEGNVIQQANALIAQEIADDYAWINCTTGAYVPGASGQIFAPASSGSYAVTITNDGCVSTTSCLDIQLIDVSEIFSPEIEIYPNPAEDACYIRSTGHAIIQMELFDTIGHSVKNTVVIQTRDGLYILSLQDIPSGVYTLVLSLSDQTRRVRKLTVR